MSSVLVVAVIATSSLSSVAADGQSSAPGCYATPISLTPPSWRAPARAPRAAPKAGLKLVGEIPLPGPANRFDYQSVDPATGRIYMNHMNAGRSIVFDANRGKVITEISDLPRATGVWAVPSHHQVYVSAAGAHEVAIIDDRTLKVIARVGGIRFPVSERIVQRYNLPGSDHPHGFTLDEPGRLAFITSEGNGKLQVVDLGTMKVLQTLKVPDDPDVLAWDPSLRRLYVASEAGALSAFWLDGIMLRPIGEVRAPRAHTVSVDPRTHLVYLPLENVNGRPVLRIFEPNR